ncbi:S1 family peptidase [Sphingobacterium spiritivorum]|uniref:S1 family peptidase n=2 Tax=Sphingobacterium spiritivorum TaxID=258 RepID=UPI003DA2BC98
MKIKKQLKVWITIALIHACIPSQILAQSNQKSLINDLSIIEKIEIQADLALKNKEWKIENLRKSITHLKETDSVKFSLPPAETNVLTSEDIYDKRSKGTLIVSNYYNCGNCSKMHSSTSTGVVLSEEGYCITNYHVLQDIIEGTEESKLRDSLSFVADSEGNIYRISDILAYSKAADIAIFKVDTKGDKFSPIPLGLPARTGAKVHAITHPDSRYYFYSQGVVARNVTLDTQNSDGERMEITADYAKGSSGGPILDSYGNLIGLVSTTQSVYYDQQEQKNLQMVVKSTIPVSAIKRLFKKRVFSN